MYDLLLVGAGISAATLCACLKDRLKICVVEVRPHLGGNCHDYQAAGSFIHRYGPHVFHSRSPAVVEFLSRYTEWVPYRHRVEAEVEEGGGFRLVPFPYCRATARVLGRSLSEAEVLEKFFHGYSRKMWGLDWERLPDVVRGRVPKETRESPDYFPGQFVALPRHGYTRLLENMVDGVEILL
ncbi:MAG: NAD(P)-binding protein, partial [Planctomycetes bacterium]|nr:NAD(P)-binding protein [Planctomycetota bacterium]